MVEQLDEGDEKRVEYRLEPMNKRERLFVHELSDLYSIYSTGRDPVSLSSYLFDRATDDVITVPSKERSDLLSHGLVHFLPPRHGVLTAPAYLDPITMGTGERVPFCQAFPELCPEGS